MFVLASISSGFGEINYLALTASYHKLELIGLIFFKKKFQKKKCISAFSSGTGAAGVLGSSSYLALTYIFPREKFGTNATKYGLILSSPLPLLMAFSYFILMTKPKPKPSSAFEEEIEEKPTTS